jgi:hypothetical protein
VLTPVAAYIQQYAPTMPVNLYFHCPQDETDIWKGSIEKEAERLALPLAELQPLDDSGLPGWLMAAGDSAPQILTCLVFAEMNEASGASEEAAALLLASAVFCRTHKLSPTGYLPRPLLTPYAHLPDALALMFAQQLPAGKIRHASYSQLPKQQTEALQLLRTERLTACPVLFDADSALGNPGGARTAVQLVLAVQSSSPTLLFSGYEGQCWLQQVMVTPGERR